MAIAAKKTRDIEADWDSRAMSASIAAVRDVVSKDGINSRAMISSLSELEWGWIVAASVFAWIKIKAQQAVEEGTSYDLPIRTMTSRDPQPWEAGAVETILPALGVMELPWDKSLSDWPKGTITTFAWQIYRLVSSALAARDEGSRDTITKRLSSQDETEREMSAANGGSLMSRKEIFDDDIPF